MDQDVKLPIKSHLEELRKRLTMCAIAVAITTGASFYFAGDIIEVLKSRADGINLQFIEMTEMFGTYCVIAIFMGIALALPYITYQLVMFIRPALTGKERGYLYFLLPAVFLSFAAGVAFGYFVLIPPAAKFLITFGSDIAEPQIRVGNFVSVMVKLLFGIGLCFETPILILFLCKIGIVSPEGLARKRKFAIVGAFILGAIITPTFDPINQSLVAVPLIALYEFGILLARIFRRREKVPKSIASDT
ncbi:MAG: twin-arginine translocase subunit TatC [Dehalococcoidia bacterium]|nr:twin-arginine translocase subunit TatC [Dehalococcoidia bacterium]